MDLDYGEGMSILFGNDLSGIILGIILFFIGYIFYFRKKKYSNYKLCLLLVLFIYMTMVIGVTLTPFPINSSEIKFMQEFYKGFDYYNLVLFKNVLYLFDQFILNIILFIPFGILYPLYKEKINFKFTLLSSFIFTLIIETLQFAFSSLFQAPAWFFDINDIVANVLGGIIGFIIVNIIIKAIALFAYKRKNN